jgi:4-carboxymuconolactone decarboxylase
MTAAQKALQAEMLAVWKRASGGPFDLWYASPELGQVSNRLGQYCRWKTTLTWDVLETAILTVAAHWDQAYEWTTHAKNAKEAGLGDATIAAIKAHAAPVFQTVEQAAAHDVAREILESRKLSAATYERVAAVFDSRDLVELASIVGWYSSLAIQMNIFDVGAA